MRDPGLRITETMHPTHDTTASARARYYVVGAARSGPRQRRAAAR
ncbi:hypothetical protein LG3211_1491 [Lysobacter gummosus]|nr:hypothetical protein LG3211_1491 [Lysobacter gummosus]